MRDLKRLLARAYAGGNFEPRTIEPVPPSERQGRPASLLAVWFSAQMNLATLVVGAIAIVLGLSVPVAIAAIVVGNLVGAIFMAYHSAQGPQLGIPQMIQSRAQFGVLGAIIPLIVVVVMYVGYFAVAAVLGGQACAELLGVSVDVGIVLCSVIALLVALFGYQMVHAVEHVVAIPLIVLFAVLTVKLAGGSVNGHLDATNSATAILATISVAATYQVTYAPYVADYSRYLPETVTVRATFWYTYIGSVLGSAWMMVVGAVGTAAAGSTLSDNTPHYLSHLLGGAAWAALLLFVVGIAAINALNIYGPFMCAMTIMTAFGTPRISPVLVRAVLTTLACTVGTVIAIAGRGNFVDNYENFILMLLYVMGPWTAINLVDFYLVRRGRYVIGDLLERDGGIYGRVNWRALAVYFAAMATQIPFIGAEMYTGPVAKSLGGADTGWIVGIVVASALYYLVMRRRGAVEPAPQVQDVGVAGPDLDVLVAGRVTVGD